MNKPSSAIRIYSRGTRYYKVLLESGAHDKSKKLIDLSFNVEFYDMFWFCSLELA